MAADDWVTYNGISMRRDYAESLQVAQRRTHYRVAERLVARIHFGDETYPMVSPGSGQIMKLSQLVEVIVKAAPEEMLNVQELYALQRQRRYAIRFSRQTD